jgi:hypothetical protein
VVQNRARQCKPAGRSLYANGLRVEVTGNPPPALVTGMPGYFRKRSDGVCPCRKFPCQKFIYGPVSQNRIERLTVCTSSDAGVVTAKSPTANGRVALQPTTEFERSKDDMLGL